MVKEVAVFLGADGVSAGLGEPGKVTVFRRAQGLWEPAREMESPLAAARGLKDLRQGMSELLQFLADCRVFVAKSATGVPYFELEKAGCSVWEIAGKPEEFLDQVWDDEEADRQAPPDATVTVPVPEEISPGHYYISIKEIQEKNADLSSKQVLQQFVRNGCYSSLVIVCSHVPPWIEADAIRCRLGVETEKLGQSEYKVRIIKTSC